MTFGVNLDASLNVREIGLVSLNSEPYVGSTLFQKIMRGKNPGDQFSCITPIGIKESGGLTEKNSMVINRELYAAVNTAVKGVVRKIHKNISDEIRAAAASLVELCDDIVFLNKCVNYIKSAQAAGLPVTFPRASAQCSVRSLYNPLLLDVMSKKALCRVMRILTRINAFAF